MGRRAAAYCVESLEPRALLSAVFANGSDNDLVRDAAGTDHLAYYDVASKTLKYAYRPSGGAWQPAVEIDGYTGNGVGVGKFVAINYDNQNNPGVVYFDEVDTALRYSKRSSTGVWSTPVVVETANSAGRYGSLIFNNNRVPIVTYYTLSNGELRAAVPDASSAGGWYRVTIAGAGAADEGRHTSIAMQSTGYVGIAFENTSVGQIRYLRQISASGSGVPIQFATSSTLVDDELLQAGGYTSLAFDPDDNRPAVTYYDADPANFMFARAPATDGSGDWSPRIVAGAGNNSSGKYTNLWYKSDGRARATYYNQTGNGLYVADETATPGTFGTPTLFFSGGGYEHEAAPVSDVDFTYTWADYSNGATNLYVNDTETGKNWTAATTSAVGIRGFHAATVFTDPADNKPKMWVLGGLYSNNGFRTDLADVRKSENGVVWDTVTAAAAFGARAELAALTHTDPTDGVAKLWVIGGSAGSNGSVVADTVYKSKYTAQGGLVWERAAIDTANLPAVRRHAAVVFPDPANGGANTMWVYGGINGGNAAGVGSYSDDIYKSVDGVTWTKVTDAAAFGKRAAATVVRRGDKLYLIGGLGDVGGVSANREDVWTSDDGATWTQIAGDSDDAFAVKSNAPSFDHAAAVHYDQRLWLVVGNQPWSSFNGVNWTQAGTVSSIARTGHAATLFDNKMWVIAGQRFNPNGYLGDAYWSA
jgi:hypothetical protein